MEINHITKQHYLGNIQYSNNHILYTKANMKEDLSGYEYNLYDYDLQHHLNRRLTSSNSDTSFEVLDEKTVLFVSKREDKKGTSYYTINLDGGEAQFKMNIPAPVSKITRLDDDHYLLLATNNTSYEDYLLSNDKAKIDSLKEEEKDYEVIDELPYVQNGKGFTNKLRKSLYLYEVSTNTYTKYSNTYLDVQDYLIVNHKVYFFGNEYEVMLDHFSSLFVLDLESKEVTNLLDHRMMIHSIHYIDDKLMIIGHDNKKYEYNKNPEIFIYEDHDVTFVSDYDTAFGNSVGSDCRLVGGKTMRDGDHMIYSVITSWSNSNICSFTLGGKLTRITDFKGSIDSFALGEDHFYFVGMKDDHLQEIYDYNAKEDTYTRLTDFSADYMSQGDYSKPTRVTYTKNDIDYEGFVLYPKDYDATKKYPAIVEIHGGPKVVSGDIYHFEMQLMASQGYFVLYTNPRGSDGRGNAFADVYGNMGVIDYEDIMDFMHVCLERIPSIDANRLGVTGGSYGGYMTNWIIGHTNEFKAAVSQRSISNYVSKSLTTDIGFYHNMKQTMSTPWNGVEKMWFHSPLKYANKATTPTLFIQSDEDYRCWQGDAYQMYQALVLNGCTARMCIFHGENHELSRGGKPKHRIRRLTEMMNWFKLYLGEEK